MIEPIGRTVLNGRNMEGFGADRTFPSPRLEEPIIRTDPIFQLRLLESSLQPLCVASRHLS